LSRKNNKYCIFVFTFSLEVVFVFIMTLANKIMISLVFLTSALYAQEDVTSIKKDLYKVYEMKNEVERLAAYDSLAKTLGAGTKKVIVPTSGMGKWKISKDVSAMDDSVTIVARLYSNDTVQSSYKSYRPVLIFRKSEGEFNAYITTDSFLGTGNISVTIRVDKNKSVKRNWNTSTDHKAIFHRDPKLLNKVLLKSNKLVVRIVPYSESPITFSFDTSGLEEVMKQFK